MISPHDEATNAPPIWEVALESCYSLELVAQLTGVSEQTILHYQEHDLLPASDAFDEEALLTISRIEHLRSTYQANLQGVKHILNLLAEIENLQRQLRARR